MTDYFLSVVSIKYFNSFAMLVSSFAVLSLAACVCQATADEVFGFKQIGNFS